MGRRVLRIGGNIKQVINRVEGRNCIAAGRKVGIAVERLRWINLERDRLRIDAERVRWTKVLPVRNTKAAAEDSPPIAKNARERPRFEGRTPGETKARGPIVGVALDRRRHTCG